MTTGAMMFRHLVRGLTVAMALGTSTPLWAQVDLSNASSKPNVLSVVHSFDGADGAEPYAALFHGNDGNLYGSTLAGGTDNFGTLFKITPRGQLTVLHSFNSLTDGNEPSVALAIGQSGALFGLSRFGGDVNAGTFFDVTSRGKFTVLHALDYFTEGAGSFEGALAIGTDGNFYGTTNQGGANYDGTAIRISPTGEVTVLHTFTGADGAQPQGGLTLASDGNFYGTASSGGPSGLGCLFRLSMQGEFTVISELTKVFGNGGRSPFSAPTQGNDGYLYGASDGGNTLDGVVYRVALDGSDFKILYNFGAIADDGMGPNGTLLLASDGNFYGVTSNGGAYHTASSSGDGIIYRISPSGKYSILYQFGASPTEPSVPIGGLIEVSGVLWGVTSLGGASGQGTIFKFALPRQ